MNVIEPEPNGVESVESPPRDGRWRARGVALVGAVALIVGVTGGIATASIPTADGVISACYTKSGSSLRVIDADSTGCKSGETRLDWNAQGVPGSDGQPGTDGVSGYEVVHHDRVVESTTTSIFAADTAMCPAGKVVLGGGVEFRTANGPTFTTVSQILSSAPNETNDGWTVAFSTDTNGIVGITTIRVYATCIIAQ